MGAVILTPEVANSIPEDSSYYSTYGWHPLSVHAAIANLKYLLAYKDQLMTNVNLMSGYFREGFESLKFKYPAKLNIIGLAMGVEFNHPKYATQIQECALKKGLLLSLHSDTTLIFFPALNIDKKTIDKGLKILSLCL